jgi:hypothetical protein
VALTRLASPMLSRWPYGHAMDSRCADKPLRKNDMPPRNSEMRLP